MTTLIGKKRLREITSISIQHLTRLEQAGKFPKRLRLTDCQNGRVAWRLDEVEAWIEERTRLRDSKQ